MNEKRRAHDELRAALHRLIEKEHQDYNRVSEALTTCEQNTSDLPDEISDVLFEFSDLLEGLLIVCKRREDVDQSDTSYFLRELLFIHIRIYSIIYNMDTKKVPATMHQLFEIKDEMKKRGILPTLEEYNAETSELMKILTDEERRELANMFT